MKLTNNPVRVSPQRALKPLMDQLLTAHHNLRAFQAKHPKIFDEFDELTQAIEVAQNELKTRSKQIGTGYSTASMECEYVMPKRHWYDAEELRRRVSKDILSSLGVIIKKEEVDEKLLKMLVRAKKIKKSVMEAAYREAPTGAPRVTITLKNTEESDDDEG